MATRLPKSIDIFIRFAQTAASVKLDEQTLRTALKSPYADTCGDSILMSIAEGAELWVVMSDGSDLHLQSREDCLTILGNIFGWRPPRARRDIRIPVRDSEVANERLKGSLERVTRHRNVSLLGM